MKKKSRLAQWVLLSLLVGVPWAVPLASAAETRTQNRALSVAKATRLLQDSGYTHRKTGEYTWFIPKQGTSRFPLLVAAGEDYLVVGIIVAEKKNIKSSPDLSFKLLKLNHSLDYVKCGFDDDDDLFVRIEDRIRVIDLQAFKAMVEGVIKGADQAYETVRPSLITP